ncbi:MAG: hypothetical protein ACRDJK_14850, partial [Actinomycetota bacterium]
NPGGHSVVTLRTESGQLFPTLEGNATYVYRTRFDSGAVLSGQMSTISSELYDDEIASFETLNRRNVEALKAAHVLASS